MAILIRLLRLLVVPLILGWLVKSFMSDLRRDGKATGGFDWRRFSGPFGPFGPGGPYGGGPGNNQSGGTGTGTSWRPPDSPWDVLGLPKNASVNDIKKRYRELVAQYHPDRFAGMADADFSDLAAKKFKALQEAYETLRRLKGF